MNGKPAPGRETPGRRWFLALAWVTLALFAAFVAVIVVGVASIPRLRRPRRAGAASPARQGRP